MTRVAAVDVGTNSVRLLVAEAPATELEESHVLDLVMEGSAV